MKYFILSDVHGQYDLMIAELIAKGFNKKVDTLVSVGDPFDRGPKSKEVLEYLMSCPHRILIWGNHDARLYQLMKGSDYVNYYDLQNGVTATLKSFTGIGPQAGLDTQIYLLNYDATYLKIAQKLYQYFRECCWAVEFEDLIATHAWLPYTKDLVTRKHSLLENWRDIKAQDLWFECSWGRSDLLYGNEAFPDKTLLIGHWHAWRLAYEFGKEPRYIPNPDNPNVVKGINCDMWISPDKKLIAIDGCSNYDKGGKVNVYVYESEVEPIKYPIQTE